MNIDTSIAGRHSASPLSIGCDMHSVANVRQSIEVFGNRYLERVFTPRELAECHGSPERFAGRYAAKEAVVKALRVPASVSLPWHSIEIHADAAGAPVVTLTGSAAEYAAAAGYAHVEVSLSHDAGMAIAFAVASHEAPEAPTANDPLGSLELTAA